MQSNYPFTGLMQSGFPVFHYNMPEPALTFWPERVCRAGKAGINMKEERWLIPTVELPMIETPVEYPVANAVFALWEENPISSGFMFKLNNQWTIVFRGLISQKAVQAAEGTGLKVHYRTFCTDVYFPGGTVLDFEKAKLAFDELASRYSGIPKYSLPIGAPTEIPKRIE